MVTEHAQPGPRFPFDQVVVSEGAEQRTLSPGEFLSLPLAQRIQYVVQQRASFYAADKQLDPKEALGQMRRIRAQLH